MGCWVLTALAVPDLTDTAVVHRLTCVKVMMNLLVPFPPLPARSGCKRSAAAAEDSALMSNGGELGAGACYRCGRWEGAAPAAVWCG